MGNRAVITTRENYENNGVGVYLHWNGGRDSVEAFLKYCELKGFRSPTTQCYGWARLAQVISNFFGGTLSIGIDTVDKLDCDNWDNGVYIIEDWKIVGRECFDGEEQHSYDLAEMLKDIDDAQPVKEQLGSYLTGELVKYDELHVGDKVYIMDWNGHAQKVTIKGFGANRVVNGTNVNGLPFAHIVSTSRNNINNYIRTEYIRIAKRKGVA